MKPWNPSQRFIFWFFTAFWFLVLLAGASKAQEYKNEVYQPLFAFENHPSATYQFGDVWLGAYNQPEPMLFGWIAPSKKADYAMIEIHYRIWMKLGEWTEIQRVKHVVTLLAGKNRMAFDMPTDIDIGQIVKVKVIYLNVAGSTEKGLK